MPKNNYRGAPYMKPFGCIGGDCELSCCCGWKIPLSDEDTDRMKQFLKEDFTEEFQEKHFGQCQLNDKTLNVIKLKTNNSCVFLDENKLCELHKNYGPECLSVVCATFPRYVFIYGNITEAAATTACPEVGRLCLLKKDACRIIPLEEDQAPPNLRFKGVYNETDSIPFLDLRTALLNILQNDQFPLPTKLFCTAKAITDIQAGNNLRSVISTYSSQEIIAEYHHLAGTLECTPHAPLNILFNLLPEFMNDDSAYPLPQNDPRRNRKLLPNHRHFRHQPNHSRRLLRLLHRQPGQPDRTPSRNYRHFLQQLHTKLHPHQPHTRSHLPFRMDTHHVRRLHHAANRILRLPRRRKLRLPDYLSHRRRIRTAS